MFPLSKKIKSSELANSLGLCFIGDDLLVDNIASLDDASKGSLSFASKNVSGVTKNFTCIAENHAATFDCLVLSKNPRYDFIRALNYLVDNKIVDNKKFIGLISSKAKIHSTAIVEEGASIGDGCCIGPYTHIRSNAVINKNCLIGSHSDIGHDGFSFERHGGCVSRRMPHFGRVLIGENVEIGNSCSISRGVLQDTVIGDDVKIDDQSYVAHNVNVRRGSLLMSGCRLNGRVTVGKQSWIGTGSVIKEGVSIGDNAIIGMSSCVINDVDSDITVAGNPSRRLRK